MIRSNWRNFQPHLVTLALLAPGLAAFVGLFAYPILITFIQSLRPEGVADAWTLENYRAFLADERSRQVIILTFQLAASATLLSVVLSVPLALILREKMAGHRFFRLLVLVPLVVPGLIGALGLLLFYGNRGWFNLGVQLLPFVEGPVQIAFTVPGLMLFYVWLYFPYTCVTTLSSLEGLDRAVEEAGAVSGARPWHVFRFLILPQIIPGILAGSVLTFMAAFGAFSVPLIAGGEYRPLAVQIYKEISVPIPAHWSAASAMAIVMGLLQATSLTLYMRLLRRRPVN